MTRAQPIPRFTVAEYLRLEEQAEVKHEFHDGEILAMSGGSPEHSLISANVGRAIGNRLGGKPCRIYESNLRIGVLATGRMLYPDASIICGPLERHPEDPARQTVTNPRTVIEVLSPTTEAYDRGEKFSHYQQIPSFQEYVLVSQAGALIETFFRRDDGSWLYTPFRGPDATARLQSLGIDLPLAEVYEGVEFPPPAPPPPEARVEELPRPR